jgi:HSP20 family protein
MFDMVPFRRNNSLKRGDAFDNLVDSFFDNDFFTPMNMDGFGNGFKVDLKENETSYVVCERRYGEFKRSFYIDNVDDSNITASFKDGVLRVDLPKLNREKSNSKKIDIH